MITSLAKLQQKLADQPIDKPAVRFWIPQENAVRFLPDGKIDLDLSVMRYEFKHEDECPLCEAGLPLAPPPPALVRVEMKKEGETEWKTTYIKKSLYDKIQKLFNDVTR